MSAFQQSQHHAIDNLNEILYLVFDVAVAQILVDCVLVLVFIDELGQGEAGAVVE